MKSIALFCVLFLFPAYVFADNDGLLCEQGSGTVLSRQPVTAQVTNPKVINLHFLAIGFDKIARFVTSGSNDYSFSTCTLTVEKTPPPNADDSSYQGHEIAIEPNLVWNLSDVSTHGDIKFHFNLQQNSKNVGAVLLECGCNSSLTTKELNGVLASLGLQGTIDFQKIPQTVEYIGQPDSAPVTAGQ